MVVGGRGEPSRPLDPLPAPLPGLLPREPAGGPVRAGRRHGDGSGLFPGRVGPIEARERRPTPGASAVGAAEAGAGEGGRRGVPEVWPAKGRRCAGRRQMEAGFRGRGRTHRRPPPPAGSTAESPAGSTGVGGLGSAQPGALRDPRAGTPHGAAPRDPPLRLASRRPGRRGGGPGRGPRRSAPSVASIGPLPLATGRGGGPDRDRRLPLEWAGPDPYSPERSRRSRLPTSRVPAPPHRTGAGPRTEGKTT